MKRFLEIIIDDSSRTLEVLNWSSDDTHLINNVSAMQNVKMQVRCDHLDTEPLKDEIIIKGYSSEDGLYSRLLLDYKNRTGKSLNRW